MALVAIVVSTSTIFISSAAGLAQQSEIAASIYEGTCDALGGEISSLEAAVVPAGEPRGVETALPAANSFTIVPIPIDALVTSDRAIAVPFPAGDQIVACGDVGGTFTDTGVLMIGLAPSGDEDISGIAYLSPGADPSQTNISLFLSGEDLDSYLNTTFLPLPELAAEDVTRFSEILAGRSSAISLAGPFAGTLQQQAGARAVRGAGIDTEEFVTTVTFINPSAQTETPWDVGIAFHQNADPSAAQVMASAAQEIVVSSDSVWSYQDATTGTVQTAPVSNFDATPGASNTLDLVVAGREALVGLNGELLAKLELPPPTSSDIFVTTDFSADHIVDGREIRYTDFQVWSLPEATTQAATPPAPQDGAATFAAALASRDSAASLGGPVAGTLHQRPGMLAAVPIGATAESFSASIAFVNPTEPAGAPWDYGLAFHQNLELGTVQEVYVDSSGFWYYTDFPNGVQQSGIVPGYDANPGAMNTLDLIVKDTTARFGVNGEYVATFTLPPATASDVLGATDFASPNIVEGREIVYSAFQVWELAATTAPSATPSADVAGDDAARFAAALDDRKAQPSEAGPFANSIAQRQGSFHLWGSKLDAEDFSATATFINPNDQTGVPWDIGFAFHQVGEAYQAIYVDSDGFWYYKGVRSGLVPSFDPSSGATNTLDLIVAGNTALFGVNGEYVTSIDLAPTSSFGIYVGTGFVADYRVEGREISFEGFEVWT